jgi:hypothetical protein
MNIRNRLQRLEQAAKPALQHTCGPIEYVEVYDGDEEPPDPPPCRACDLEAQRTGQVPITRIIVCRGAP